jgi:UDP-glucose 4-epimerase
MKVLVTGGAGFIGSHIVDTLIESGYEVVVVDNLSTGKKEYLHEKAVFYHIDLHSPKLDDIFAKELPDFIIHEAAQVDVSISIKDPYYDAYSNILGAIHLLELSRKYHIKKFIYSSSCAVYGETGDYSIQENNSIQPISFYGASKYTPEQYIQIYQKLYGLSFTILRYANVYGPRQTPKGEGGVISIFVQKLLKNENPIIFGDGTQTRDFVYVKDVAYANLLALTKGENQILNVSLNKKNSINELFLLLSLLIPHSTTPIYKPSRNGDILFSRLDNQKVKEQLGWQPKFDLFQGLKETHEFYKHN